MIILWEENNNARLHAAWDVTPLLAMTFDCLYFNETKLEKLSEKLNERLDKDAKSYWNKKDNGVFAKEQYERQF